jgi:short-subunit dehydrogenase
MRSPQTNADFAKYPNIIIFPLDVLDTQSIDEAVQNTIRIFGKIDVLLNNAGYAAFGPFEAASPQEIKKQFDVNLFGLMNVTQYLLPYFREKKSGTIINVSSMAGRVAFPFASLYNGSKWALEGFSEALQHELSYFNIRIKLIEPGAIKTDFYGRSMNVLSKEGLTAYQPHFNINFWENAGEKAPTPYLVAKTIYKAATDNSHKLRYPVTFQAKGVLFLRWLLPDRIFNWSIRKYFPENE